MAKINVFVIGENNQRVEKIEDDFFGIIKAMNISQYDYFNIFEVEIKNKKYDLYAPQINHYKNTKKITAMFRNKEKFFCGTLIITKHNKKQELISLIDIDIDNISSFVQESKEKTKHVNGIDYEFSDKILLI